MATTMVLIAPVLATVQGKPHKFLPGEVLSDPLVLAAVVSAGGCLVSSSPSILAAAALARKLQRKGSDATPQALLMLAFLAASVGATTSPPYTQASPLPSGVAYQMLATDGPLFVAAGALVKLPAIPAPREYLVKVVSGTAEASPVQVFAGGSYSVEDPGGGAPYALVSGATPASIKISAACNGWSFDGATMNLTR